jgi:hypothetical protein
MSPAARSIDAWLQTKSPFDDRKRWYIVVAGFVVFLVGATSFDAKPTNRNPCAISRAEGR